MLQAWPKNKTRLLCKDTVKRMRRPATDGEKPLWERELRTVRQDRKRTPRTTERTRTDSLGQKSRTDPSAKTTRRWQASPRQSTASGGAPQLDGHHTQCPRGRGAATPITAGESAARCPRPGRQAGGSFSAKQTPAARPSPRAPGRSPNGAKVERAKPRPRADSSPNVDATRTSYRRGRGAARGPSRGWSAFEQQ